MSYLVEFDADKIENAADVVEEVADTVNQVAKFTEDIAEKLEKNSNEDSVIHQTAAYVDNISEKVGMEAEIVKNKAEEVCLPVVNLLYMDFLS